MKEVDMIVYGDNILTCRGDGKPKSGKDMADVGYLGQGAIVIENGIIVKVGGIDEVKSTYKVASWGREIWAGKNVVMPGLIDSHTHPIYEGNRVNEFIMRSRGATYQDIHEAGGGIQFTVDKTRESSFEQLCKKTEHVFGRMLKHGTTTVEAKSGYGLETEEEIRELEIIKLAAENSSVDVVATFLGAHSIPKEYKENRKEYIRIVIEEMMPRVKKERLAKFVDVFCEEGAFTLEETEQILKAAKKLEFGLKAHSEEFTNLGSAVLVGKLGGVSTDHLLRISDSDIENLAKTDTILTLMPGTLFFLDYNEFAPARKIIDKGAKMALATDYNAGSCMSLSMQMAMSLGCIKMKMLPEEAINASTYNAAFAVGMPQVGSIEEGKIADLVIFDETDYRLIPYRFGENLVSTVIKNGEVVVEGGNIMERQKITAAPEVY